MEITRRIYRQFVEEFAREICGSKFSDGIVSIIIHGSAVRGDFFSGISDIDFLVVVEDGIWKEQRFNFSQKLHRLLLKLRKKYPQIHFFDFRRNPSLLIITRSQALKGYPIEFDLEALKTIYGKEFAKELFLDNTLNDRKALKEIIEWNIDHQLSSRCIWQAIVLMTPNELQEYVASLISYTFKATSMALAYRTGILRFKKDDIMVAAMETFNDFPRIKFIRSTYELAQDWTNLRRNKKRLWSYIWENLESLNELLTNILNE